MITKNVGPDTCCTCCRPGMAAASNPVVAEPHKPRTAGNFHNQTAVEAVGSLFQIQGYKTPGIQTDRRSVDKTASPYSFVAAAGIRTDRTLAVAVVAR